jgi:hypothetical protein
MPIIYRTAVKSRDSQQTNESLNEQSDFYFTNDNVERVEFNVNNGGDKYIDQTALNYSSFHDGKFVGRLAYAETSEGTAWLPFSLGGTYRPKGWYVWDGSSWSSDRTAISAALESGTGGGTGTVGPQGPQGEQGIQGIQGEAGEDAVVETYTHDQGIPSSLWTIDHDLDRHPSITVVDSSGSTVNGEVTYTDSNSVTIEFNAAFSGLAYLN